MAWVMKIVKGRLLAESEFMSVLDGILSCDVVEIQYLKRLLLLIFTLVHEIKKFSGFL